MDEQMIVNLLSYKKAKVVTICLIYIMTCFLGFMILIAPNHFLRTAIILVYFILLVFGVYIMFKTKNKLISANTFAGICFLVFAIGFYSIFIYNAIHLDILNIMLAVIAFISFAACIEVILQKTKFVGSKSKNKNGSGSMFGYFLGTIIGSLTISRLKMRLDQNGELIFGMTVCLVMFFLFIFLGIYYLNKSYMAFKHNKN